MNPNEPLRTPIQDYLKAVENRNNRLWRVGSDGIPKTEQNGRWVSSEEFLVANPIPSPVNFYGGKSNPDGTKKFLYH